MSLALSMPLRSVKTDFRVAAKSAMGATYAFGYMYRFYTRRLVGASAREKKSCFEQMWMPHLCRYPSNDNEGGGCKPCTI